MPTYSFVNNKFKSFLNFCRVYNLLPVSEENFDVMSFVVEEIFQLSEDALKANEKYNTLLSLGSDEKINNVITQESQICAKKEKVRILNVNYWSEDKLKQLLDDQEKVKEFCKENKLKNIFRYVADDSIIQEIANNIDKIKEIQGMDDISLFDKITKVREFLDSTGKVEFRDFCSLSFNHFVKRLLEFIEYDIYDHKAILTETLKVTDKAIVDFNKSPTENSKLISQSFSGFIMFDIHAFLTGEYQQSVIKSLIKYLNENSLLSSYNKKCTSLSHSQLIFNVIINSYLSQLTNNSEPVIDANKGEPATDIIENL